MLLHRFSLDELSAIQAALGLIGFDHWYSPATPASASREFSVSDKAMLSKDFAAFKAGEPARQMFRKLGLIDYLDEATSWRHLRMLIVEFNGFDQGNFANLARDVYGVSSAGERVLLQAILYVTDFAWLADELVNGQAWQDMHRAGGDWRRAVAACIAAGLPT